METSTADLLKVAPAVRSHRKSEPVLQLPSAVASVRSSLNLEETALARSLLSLLRPSHPIYISLYPYMPMSLVRPRGEKDGSGSLSFLFLPHSSYIYKSISMFANKSIGKPSSTTSMPPPHPFSPPSPRVQSPPPTPSAPWTSTTSLEMILQYQAHFVSVIIQGGAGQRFRSSGIPPGE